MFSQSDDGEFVLAADALALEQRVEELERERDENETELDHALRCVVGMESSRDDEVRKKRTTHKVLTDMVRDLRTQLSDANAARERAEPIPVLLYCPNCGGQHVDAPQPEKGWTNPPHRSHECQACGWIWRVADVATVGVASIATKGQADDYPGGRESLSSTAIIGGLRSELREARQRVEEREAREAAMRACLIRHKEIHSTMRHHEECDLAHCYDCAYEWEPCNEHPDAHCDCCLNATETEKALATNAGKALMDELTALRASEVARDKIRAAFGEIDTNSPEFRAEVERIAERERHADEYPALLDELTALQSAGRLTPAAATVLWRILATVTKEERHEPAMLALETELTTLRAAPGRGRADCIDCGEGTPANDCAKSKRSCGHHCNHAWSHDGCCWCGREWGCENEKRNG